MNTNAANIERHAILGKKHVSVREPWALSREQYLYKVGGVAAITGAVLSIAAISASKNLPVSSVIETVFHQLSSQPGWLWPVVNLALMIGAVCWVIAFSALGVSLQNGSSWAFGKISILLISIGAALLILDSSVSGFGLQGLASAWAEAPETDQSAFIIQGDLILRQISALWAGALIFFYGAPFLLSGIAVIRSHVYPSWLGWAGLFGGLGAIVAGGMLIFGSTVIDAALIYLFTMMVSAYMAVIGWRMLRHSES